MHTHTLSCPTRIITRIAETTDPDAAPWQVVHSVEFDCTATTDHDDDQPHPVHSTTADLEAAERIAIDLNQSGMDGDQDTVALFLEQAIHLARVILSGDLDDHTSQVLLGQIESATETMADTLDSLTATDVPR